MAYEHMFFVLRLWIILMEFCYSLCNGLDLLFWVCCRHSLKEVLEAPNVMNIIKDTKAAQEVLVNSIFSCINRSPLLQWLLFSTLHHCYFFLMTWCKGFIMIIRQLFVAITLRPLCTGSSSEGIFWHACKCEYRCVVVMLRLIPCLIILWSTTLHKLQLVMVLVIFLAYAFEVSIPLHCIFVL